MNCARCGRNHATDPALHRPTPVLQLPPDARALRVKESDDLCRILPWMSEREPRYFVRGVMFVTVDSVPQATAWGLWAEVAFEAFETYVRNFRSADQGQLPALAGALANTIRGYPETLGLPISLQMTTARKRPVFSFLPTVDHPFAAEVRAGVTADRFHRWLSSAGG